MLESSKQWTDGCQRYAVDLQGATSFCQACGCHSSFHVDERPAGMFLPITPITAQIVTNSDIQNPLPSTSSTLPSVLTSPPPSRASTPVSVTHKAEAAASTLAIINTAVRTFPEWPDGDIILEMTPHSLSGFKTTGWATTGLKSWSTHGTKCLKVKCIGLAQQKDAHL